MRGAAQGYGACAIFTSVLQVRVCVVVGHKSFDILILPVLFFAPDGGDDQKGAWDRDTSRIEMEGGMRMRSFQTVLILEEAVQEGRRWGKE